MLFFGIVQLVSANGVEVLETAFQNLNWLILGLFVKITSHKNRNVPVLFMQQISDYGAMLNSFTHVYGIRGQMGLTKDKFKSGITFQLKLAVHQKLGTSVKRQCPKF